MGEPQRLNTNSSEKECGNKKTRDIEGFICIPLRLNRSPIFYSHFSPSYFICKYLAKQCPKEGESRL